MEKLLVGITGVYGKNNLGDEALLQAVIADVLAIRPDAQFVIFCSAPAEVTTQYGLYAVSRKPFSNFFSKLSLIKRMDVFIVGGGTLLYEQGSSLKNTKAILAFYFWPVLAKTYGVRTVAYGQGLGPINSFAMKVAVRYLHIIFDLITLRDKQSSEYIKSGSNAYLTSDPVAASELFSKDISDANEKTPSYLLIAFRFPQAGNMTLIGQWVKSISAFAKNEECKIILFPTQLSKAYFEDELLLDEEYHLLVAFGIKPANIQKARWSTIEEGVGYLQGARVVVSNRLHALLLAAKAGVPCVGLGGNDKIRGCLSMIGIEKPVYFLEQENATPDIMNQILIEAWHIPQTEKQRIVERLLAWVKREPTNISHLKEIFKK